MTTTGSGGVIALIVAVVAIVLIVWFVMVSGDGADTANGNGDVTATTLADTDTGGDVTVPTTTP